jgi:hypothetical protein
VLLLTIFPPLSDIFKADNMKYCILFDKKKNKIKIACFFSITESRVRLSVCHFILFYLHYTLHISVVVLPSISAQCN